MSRLTCVVVYTRRNLWVNRANWWFGSEHKHQTHKLVLFCRAEGFRGKYRKINIQTRRFGPSRKKAGFFVAGRLWLPRFVIIYTWCLASTVCFSLTSFFPVFFSLFVSSLLLFLVNYTLIAFNFNLIWMFSSCIHTFIPIVGRVTLV